MLKTQPRVRRRQRTVMGRDEDHTVGVRTSKKDGAVRLVECLCTPARGASGDER